MDENKPKILETSLLTPDEVSIMYDFGRTKNRQAHVFHSATIELLNDIAESREPVECDCCREGFKPKQRPVYLIITIDTAEEPLHTCMIAGICGACAEAYSKRELISKFEDGIRALGEDWQRLDPGNMPDDSGNA